MSAYFIFMGDYRNHCKMTGEANVSNVSDLSQLLMTFIKLCTADIGMWIFSQVTDFTKTASAKWREMDLAARAPYEARAAAEKQRYEQQMSMYVPTPGFSTKGSRKRVS